MLDEVNELIGITPLIIIPSNELYEMIVEHNARVCIEDGSSLIMIEIGGNNCILGVADDAGEFFALACRLHCCLDLIIGGGLFKYAGEVNNGNIYGGHTHAHTGKLAVKGRNNLAYGLCCAGAAGNNVMSCCTAAAPILTGSTVNGELSCGDGVNGGHETFLDAEIIIDDLCKRCKAVRGAACIGNNVHFGLVFLIVYAHNEHGSSVLCRCGNNDLLRAANKMLAGELGSGEFTCGLNDVFSACFRPRDFLGIHAAVNGNRLTVYDELAVFNLDLALKLSMNGIIPEQIRHVFKVDEGIVDARNCYLGVCCSSTENESSYAAKAVDADIDSH